QNFARGALESRLRAERFETGPDSFRLAKAESLPVRVSDLGGWRQALNNAHQRGAAKGHKRIVGAGREDSNHKERYWFDAILDFRFVKKANPKSKIQNPKSR